MRALLALVALSLLTGCVANMADLKDKVSGATEEPEALEAAAIDTVNVTNFTAPVARVKIFGENNALLYDAGFKAEDVTAPLFVPKAIELKLLAGDSEALHRGAKIVRTAWTLDGRPLGEAPVATAVLTEPGVHPLVLTVTDSNNVTDTQLLVLAVAPDPFEAYLNLTSAPMAGARGTGQASKLDFELSAELAGIPATVKDVRIVASPPATCDVALALLDAEGAAVASVDDADTTTMDQSETLEAGALPEAAYAIRLTPSACVAHAGFPVQVIVTFLPMVEGLSGGDGHGHAH